MIIVTHLIDIVFLAEVWPNRDPLGERGGINLYTYVGNDPVDLIDPFGLDHNYVVIRILLPLDPALVFVLNGRSEVGSSDWSRWSHIDSRFYFCSYKCNKFVYDMAKLSGLTPPSRPVNPGDPWSPLRPATAEELSDLRTPIDGWSEPRLGDAKPGDIVSDGAHTGIEAGPDRISASSIVNEIVENGWGAGQWARSPIPVNPPSQFPINYSGSNKNRVAGW